MDLSPCSLSFHLLYSLLESVTSLLVRMIIVNAIVVVLLGERVSVHSNKAIYSSNRLDSSWWSKESSNGGHARCGHLDLRKRDGVYVNRTWVPSRSGSAIAFAAAVGPAWLTMAEL